MQQKTQEERRLSALIMVTAKAAEGCETCLEGYKRVAVEAGATQKDIDFALTAGKRARAKVSVDTPSIGEERAEIINEETSKQSFLQEAMTSENVQALDVYFRTRGYQPLEASSDVIHYQLSDHACTEALLPYKRDADHIAWVSYHRGPSGVDLVGVVADFTQKERVLRGELLPGELIAESYIVQDGMVVPGHACDMRCFWNNLYWTCGPAVVGCLAMVEAWLACAITLCGGTATLSCFGCGCC